MSLIVTDCVEIAFCRRAPHEILVVGHDPVQWTQQLIPCPPARWYWNLVFVQVHLHFVVVAAAIQDNHDIASTGRNLAYFKLSLGNFPFARCSELSILLYCKKQQLNEFNIN